MGEQTITENTPTPPATVSYSHYMAVAESLEHTDAELKKYKALADKRKAVIIEARQAFIDAKFAPMAAEGCVKESIAVHVKALLKWTKDIEQVRDELRARCNALEVERDKLQEALMPFAEIGCNLDSLQCHTKICRPLHCIRCSRVLKARAALAGSRYTVEDMGDCLK